MRSGTGNGTRNQELERGSDSDEIRPRAPRLRAGFLSPARGLRRPAQGARHEARTGHRDRHRVRAEGTRRRGFPGGHEMEVRRQGHPEAEIHRLQRRRERARHVQGSPVDGAQPASAVRGLPDRLPRDRREGRLHLHPRRISSCAERARAAARRGLQEGIRRQERDGARMGLRHLHSSRRRRVRSRRGDRAPRIARREARAAAAEAAVSGRCGTLRLADRRQQRRDALQRAVDHAQRRRMVRGARPGEERRTEAVLRQRPRPEARVSTKRR